jgi:hypothetical protein
MEADTVHHCGASASGEYVYTVQMVDVQTGWSEHRATLGRSYTVMEDAFRNILKRLPFTIRKVNCCARSTRSWSASSRYLVAPLTNRRMSMTH